MCHETTGRPPPPPIGGGSGAATSGELVLEASDGNRFRAFTATAIDPEAAGIVVLPDVRGLHPFYRELAVRFAEVGIHATAIDYFGRTAGTQGARRGLRLHVARDADDRGRDPGRRDRRGRARPVARRVAGAARIFTVGFCLGGRLSFNQAADRDLDGVIGFYGRTPGSRPGRRSRRRSSSRPRYRCPVLGLFGAADANIPVEDLDEFRRTLDDAGVPNEIVAYEGAPHSFFDRSFAEHRDACDDAWRRMLAFVRREPA